MARTITPVVADGADPDNERARTGSVISTRIAAREVVAITFVSLRSRVTGSSRLMQNSATAPKTPKTQVPPSARNVSAMKERI